MDTKLGGPGSKPLPVIGFGTFGLKGDECRKAVSIALRVGYRLIDTASVYRNEEEVGIAVRESRVKRNDIFITSKISPGEQGEDLAYEAIQRSLSKLGLEYIDLMLIHWPGAKKVPPQSEKNRILRVGSWAALVRAQAEGLVIHIGVSNCLIIICQA